MSTAHTAVSPTAQPQARRWRRTVLISAWAVPVMVVGQFAMLAIVPVALAVTGTLRDPGLRRLRSAAMGLAVVYAAPLAMWAIGPDRERSLSRDMHPAFIPLISAAAIAFAIAVHLKSSRPAERSDTLG